MTLFLMDNLKSYADFLTEDAQKYIQETIKKPQWEYDHHDRDDRLDMKFWIQKLNSDSFYRKFVFEAIKDMTGDDLILERVYMNGYTSGEHGLFHQDCDDEDGRTFIIYCNEDWNPEYGGLTCFNIDGNLQMVYPFPYSGIYFKGTIPHFAMPISKLFTGLRVTLAYKMRIKK